MSRKLIAEYSNARPDPATRRSASILALPLAAALALASAANAEPVDDNVPLPVAIDGADATEDSRDAIDEIVVYGNRDRDGSDNTPSLPIDPLQARVLREIRELGLLEREFDWRTENARLDITPPRIRFGYDPRDYARAPAPGLQQTLPLDLVRPATVVSIDF